MSIESEQFKNALINQDKQELKKIRKGDRHIHASRGCYCRVLEKQLGVNLSAPPQNGYKNLEDMQQWVNNAIRPFCVGVDGWLKRIESMFISASIDNHTVIEPSFTLRDIDKFLSIDCFIESLNTIYRAYSKEIIFLPCLSIRTLDDLEFSLSRAKTAIDSGFFHSIDLCNKEGARDYSYYKPIYSYAEKRGLKKKAHVGEFGKAIDIKNAIQALQLDEVQHGISITEDKAILEWAQKQSVIFNVCPSSNIKLGIIKNFADHPVACMYRNGLKITIGTDDLLTFDSDLTNEYLCLYKEGCLSANELDDIRKNSLRY